LNPGSIFHGIKILYYTGTWGKHLTVNAFGFIAASLDISDDFKCWCLVMMTYKKVVIGYRGSIIVPVT
jgi:hypothetical protein